MNYSLFKGVSNAFLFIPAHPFQHRESISCNRNALIVCLCWLTNTYRDVIFLKIKRHLNAQTTQEKKKTPPSAFLCLSELNEGLMWSVKSEQLTETSGFECKSPSALSDIQISIRVKVAILSIFLYRQVFSNAHWDASCIHHWDLKVIFTPDPRRNYQLTRGMQVISFSSDSYANPSRQQ